MGTATTATGASKSKKKTSSLSSSSSSAKRSSSSSRSSKPPALDKLIYPAIGIGLAIMGWQFMKGVANEITRIDASDELALREVFFGEGRGKNYAVLCHTPSDDPKKKSPPVSSVFQDAADEYAGTRHAEFVLLDCQQVLPESGKTVAERFNIDLKKRPTIFVSGKVGPPKQVPTKHLKTGHMLTKLLKGLLEPHAQKIENTKDLKAKCLNRDMCGLLLKGGKPEPYLKDAVAKLLDTYPDVTFGSVDSTLLLLSNLEEYLPEYKPGKHRFVLFKKVSGGLDIAGKDENETEAESESESEGGDSNKNKKDGKKESGGGRLVTSIQPLQYDSLSFGSINTLVANAISTKGKSMRKIPALPTVKTRTKKLEEAERKKRERFLERERKKNEPKADQAQQQTAGGRFQANDGTREGRKAERDRRREEHHKQHNIKPKTPEEIAEMERRRRERMAEEEAKWNVGYEEDGDGAEGEEYEGFDEDDAEDDEDEEDGDVLDLD